MMKLKLSIRQKFFSLFIALVLTMFIAVAVSVTIVLQKNRDKLIAGVDQKFENLLDRTSEEFINTRNMATESIREASGLVTMDEIVNIAGENQNEFSGVIKNAIIDVGKNVESTINKQNEIVTDGLDGILTNSTDAINSIMVSDQNSQLLLSNLAEFNINQLNDISHYNINRFNQIMSSFEEQITGMNNNNIEMLDSLFISIFSLTENSAQDMENNSEKLMLLFEDMKNKSGALSDKIIHQLKSEYDLQRKMMAEEFRIVKRNALFTIQRELETSAAIQDIAMNTVIDKLLEKQMTFQAEIETTGGELQQHISHLNTEVPAILQQKGAEASRKIKDQSASAVQAARKAEEHLEDRMDTSMKTTGNKLTGIVTNAREFISGSLEESISSTLRITFIVILTCGALALLFCLWIVNRIVRPISSTVDFLQNIKGDLTRRLTVESTDEIGILAKWFNNFLENIQLIVKKIIDDSEALDNASSEMVSHSRKLLDGATETRAKSEMVTESAENMSKNMNSVAASTSQASSNLNMIASAAEEMTVSFDEIAKNTEQARHTTSAAVKQSEETISQVNSLNTAANEIGKVTETIAEISEQTNLLALNATIEAARAGEAGRGFSVVANEIKALARQTADATQEIKIKVDGIQSSTGKTMSDIDSIMKTIHDINDIVTQIASTFDEQSITTKGIAQNVAQASTGIREVNKNISETARSSSDIAREIESMNTANSESASSSERISSNASDLHSMAESLKRMVNEFKV